MVLDVFKKKKKDIFYEFIKIHEDLIDKTKLLNADN